MSMTLEPSHVIRALQLLSPQPRTLNGRLFTSRMWSLEASRGSRHIKMLMASPSMSPQSSSKLKRAAFPILGSRPKFDPFTPSVMVVS